MLPPIFNEQYQAGWKKSKLNDKCTPALRITSSLLGTFIKHYEIELPVLLSLAVLHQIHSHIYIFKGIF